MSKAPRGDESWPGSWIMGETAAMSDNLVGTKLGNYRLERLLGRGRMGVVYLARDEALLRPTAVKILSWSLPEQAGQNPEAWFLAEARNVARVNHPHVVQIYGVARHGSYCYIAMEYVEGASADVWIERQGPYSPEQATEILIQTAGALQAAHDANVIHRDIKPENLLVGRDGKAKLGDFGMAHHAVNNRSADANRAGTPHYTAPEIWRGEVASPATDIYALGATYYYLLTGRPPYAANDLTELISAHLNAPLPDLRTVNARVPQACQDLLARCMAKSKQNRIPSAQALGFEARAVLRNLASVPPGPRSDRGAQLPKNLAAPKAPSIVPSSSKTFQTLGFRTEPFVDAEPGNLPYIGEPHRAVEARLTELLLRTSCGPVLLVGPKGVGRTTLVADSIGRNRYPGQTAVVSCAPSPGSRLVVAKILRALGIAPVLDRGKSGLIDLLLDHCLSQANLSVPPLIVIDDVESPGCDLDEIGSLLLACKLSNAFRLVVIGSDEVLPSIVKLQGGRLDAIGESVVLRPLDVAQVGEYLRTWLAATLEPGRVPFLFTPDAVLLIAHRSRGLLSEINVLSRNALLASTVHERRVLDTWDVWVAPREALGEPSRERVPPKPSPWPSEEVLMLLNEARRALGLQPRR
ncbi:MAG: serine/threonine-protein kinase [Polyangiaceae bacterium]